MSTISNRDSDPQFITETLEIWANNIPQKLYQTMIELNNSVDRDTKKIIIACQYIDKYVSTGNKKYIKEIERFLYRKKGKVINE